MDAEGDGGFQLRIMSEDNPRLWWNVRCLGLHEPVKVIKHRLIRWTGRWVSKLYYCGRLLQDDMTLQSLGINEGSVLSTGCGQSILSGRRQQRQKHTADTAHPPSPHTNAQPNSRNTTAKQVHSTSASPTRRPPSGAGSSGRVMRREERSDGSIRYVLTRDEEVAVLQQRAKYLESCLNGSSHATQTTTTVEQVHPRMRTERKILTPPFPLDEDMFSPQTPFNATVYPAAGSTPSIASPGFLSSSQPLYRLP